MAARTGPGKHYFLKMVTSTTAVSIATVPPTADTSAAPRRSLPRRTAAPTPRIAAETISIAQALPQAVRMSRTATESAAKIPDGFLLFT